VSGEVVQALKGRVVHDIPIIERLKSQKGSEQVILTLLFAKAITFKEFEEKMSNLLSDTDHDELFITCAKEVFMTKGNVLVSSFCFVVDDDTVIKFIHRKPKLLTCLSPNQWSLPLSACPKK
jgi:hypothetical protein